MFLLIGSKKKRRIKFYAIGCNENSQPVALSDIKKDPNLKNQSRQLAGQIN